MKKIVALVAVLFLAAVPVQSHADSKALVIIDSYFDSRVINGNVSCILVNGTPCTDSVTKIPTSLSDNINHGDAMVEVAKKQSPSIKIIAIRAGVTPSSDVNAGNFIDALKWVKANASQVSAVSFSRYFNGTASCSPASVNTAAYGGVTVADATIKQLLADLSLAGVRVFASTGNAPKTKVDYPACILSTYSVTSPGNVSDTNTDYSADLVRLPLSGNNYVSPVFKLIPQTTSSATAAVAAQWVSLGNLTTKVVKVSA